MFYKDDVVVNKHRCNGDEDQKMKLMRKVKKRSSIESIHAVQASHSKSTETKFYCHQEYKMVCLSPQTKGKPRDV